MQIARESEMKGYNCTFLGKLCSGCLSEGFLGHPYTVQEGIIQPCQGAANLIPIHHLSAVGWKSVKLWPDVREAQDTQFLQMQMASGHLIRGRAGQLLGQSQASGTGPMKGVDFVLAPGVFGTELSNLYP